MESASEPEIDQHGEAVLLEEEMDRYLRQMRNDDRNLLGLFYWREFEVTEIAEILGVAVGAVKVRLFRARNRLRELLVESERELFSH
jgi:RNA polymerase sigma-70 factor (ECF subfamily)